VATLPRPVPVITRYATTVVHGDSVTFYPDVYRRGVSGGVDQVVRVLAESRLDTAVVDRKRLAALIKRAARKRVTVVLSSIGVVR
jgi:hypothetical protein